MVTLDIKILKVKYVVLITNIMVLAIELAQVKLELDLLIINVYYLIVLIIIIMNKMVA